MLYVLTQEEIDLLSPKAERDKFRANAMELAMRLCRARSSGNRHCIIQPPPAQSLMYCDECPSHEFCPHDRKSWSK